MQDHIFSTLFQFLGIEIIRAETLYQKKCRLKLSKNNILQNT